MKHESGTSKVLNWWWDFRLKLFVEGILCGLIAGLLVVVFRVAIEKADDLRGLIYSYLHVSSFPAKAAWFLVLILIGFILGKIIDKEPMTAGSGIPQVEGTLSGHLKMNWLRVLVLKFSGGILAIGSGLSLGREGPSIQIGATIAQGISRILGRLKIEEKYLVTAGASAGLAAAFNAPLAGVIFALEEVHKNFSSVVLTAGMAASLTADLVSQKVFGQRPVFDFSNLPILPLNYYFLLIILGLIVGAFGALFNRTLIKTLNMYGEITWLPKSLIPAIPLVISGLLGFFLPQTLGGGHKLIESVGQGQIGFELLMVFLLVKFLFTMLSYGSGVPGGIFLPLLVIGALAGNIFGNLAVQYLHIDVRYINDFVVLAMAGYFTAIVKAPVTGSVLITEMTGSFNHLLPLMTVSMTAYLISDILKSKPIYEVLLGRILKAKNHPEFGDEHKSKTIMEIPVCIGSQIDGRKIKDIVWPKDCLIVGLKRGGTEIIPNGNTRMHSGDYLIVLTSESNVLRSKTALTGLAGECLLEEGR